MIKYFLSVLGKQNGPHTSCNSPPLYVPYIMIKRILIDWIKEYWNTFSQETAHLKAEFSHEHLRLWRVAIKTYKTLCLFVEYSLSSNKKNFLTKESKKLYKVSGETRKRRLHKKKCNKLFTELTKKELEVFQKFCEKKSWKAQKIFEKSLSTYKSEEFEQEYKKILSFFTKTTIKSLQEKKLLFQNTIKWRIQSVLNKKKVSDDDIHDVRKEIKHLLYFAHLFQDKASWVIRKKYSKLLWRRNDNIELYDSLKERNKKYWSKHVKKILKIYNKDILIQKKNIIDSLTTHFTWEFWTYKRVQWVTSTWSSKKKKAGAPLEKKKVVSLDQWNFSISEFQRLFPGGIKQSASYLLAWEPWIGKSTIMLQIIQDLMNNNSLQIAYNSVATY